MPAKKEKKIGIGPTNGPIESIPYSNMTPEERLSSVTASFASRHPKEYEFGGNPIIDKELYGKGPVGNTRYIFPSFGTGVKIGINPVLLDDTLNPEELRKTLEHEYTHAGQYGKKGTFQRFLELIRDKESKVPYTERPHEIEAESRAQGLRPLRDFSLHK